MNQNDVSIELRYDSEFRKSVVERGRSDPLTGMKIRVGEMYVFGDEDHVNSDYISTNLTVQLEAVEKILSDKRATIEFANGPMWLAFEPHDEETLEILECATFEGVQDSEQRLSGDRSALVSKTAWVSELIETAEEFYERVVDLNPSLEDDQILRRLRREIAAVKEQLKEFEAG